MEQTPHIAILPSPGMGHLIPLAEFAKKLVLHHNFSVTFIIPTDGPPSKAQKLILDTLPTTITSIFLPPVNFDDLSDGVKIETRISLTVTRSLSSLRETFTTLTTKTHLVALVVDLFGTDAFEVATEFKISPYIFFPSTAMTLSFFFHLPKLHDSVSCEYRDLSEPVKLPGCIPVSGKDLLDPVQDRQDEAYTWLLHHVRRYKLAEGILVNSFIDLEPGALMGLNENDVPVPVYPVGPLIRRDYSGQTSDGLECLRWLDNQPSGSVLFVSFGSGGTLSREEMHELTLGLEMSRQRFLWVVRGPNEKEANATYFNVESCEDPFDFLPKGFMERTKGVGLVVPSWAPQVQVLSHDSTGGFLSHCGWNSTLESIVYGVPLIVWPLYAEQKMNAEILVEDLKVALRARGKENGVVERENIARVVKCLIEGEEGKIIRNRMRGLKDAVAKALSDEGSSMRSLREVAHKWNSYTCM